MPLLFDLADPYLPLTTMNDCYRVDEAFTAVTSFNRFYTVLFVLDGLNHA
jgi:hypothetical protein